MKNRSLRDPFEDFACYLASERNLALSTQEGYGHDVSLFLNHQIPMMDLISSSSEARSMAAASTLGTE
ncbi:Putative phage integrase [Estrella lausannensis]|uniref:Putative phage integrase n=1 Tax=Estrella lausannensis TaxID=483423 RepID=A0A0H5DPB7_9BACT|nr:Putative phage integrase [Estrella lausannensis]